MSFLKNIYIKYNTFILYAIYGVPPTIISFGLYLILTNCFGLFAFVSNAIAWLFGVIVSFFLYRKFVFKVKKKSLKDIFIEFIKFCSLRIFSGFSETGFIFIFVDVFNFNGLLFKVIASFLAAMLNYFVSKIFIFTNKKHNKKATN